MSPKTKTQLVLGLLIAACLGLLPLAGRAQERPLDTDAPRGTPADPAADLPTDGIDDSVPGILAMPQTIPGPDGIKLRRTVGIRRGSIPGKPIVGCTYSAAQTAQFDPRSWYVKVTFFPKPGSAHQELHSVLTLRGNSPWESEPRSWKMDFERLAGPGLVLKRRYQSGLGGFYGVLRQAYIVVQYRVPGSGVEGERQARTLGSQARQVLDELRTVIETAPPAEVGVGSRKLGRVRIERSPPGEELSPALRESRVTIEPVPETADDEPMRILVFMKSIKRTRRLVTSAGRLREKAALVLNPDTDVWAAGEEIVVMRVSEGERLAIETIRVRLVPGKESVESQPKAE